MEKMNLENASRLMAGIFVLGSILLARYHSQYWLWFTGLIGLSLIQSGFTGW